MTSAAHIIAGLAWTGGGRLLSQLIAWMVSIFVVRILHPGDYGLLAMAMVLTGFIALFAELGLGWAVVQARQVDTATLRSVLGLVIMMNGLLFALLFALAPLVAVFFAEEHLVDIVRVLALQLLIAAPAVIPDALLQRDLAFKSRAVVDVSATVATAAATLLLALTGFGVWALVLGSLFGSAWRTLGVMRAHPFLQRPSFAFRNLQGLFRFGGYVAVARAALYVCLQADMIVAGRLLGKDQLGYYSVAMQLASLPLQRASAILNEVAFPAFSRLQDERERMASYLATSIGLMGLCAFPLFWGMAAVAPEIVSLLLGERWQPAILPLQLLALIMPVRLIGQLMPPTLQAVGRARLVAANQVLACCVLTGAFIVGAQHGILGLSIAWLIGYPVVFAVQLMTWLPVTGISAARLSMVMGRPAAAGAAMFAGVAGARELGLSGGGYALALLVGLGAAFYVALTLLINREAVRDARWLLRRANAI